MVFNKKYLILDMSPKLSKRVPKITVKITLKNIPRSSHSR